MIGYVEELTWLETKRCTNMKKKMFGRVSIGFFCIALIIALVMPYDISQKILLILTVLGLALIYYMIGTVLD